MFTHDVTKCKTKIKGVADKNRLKNVTCKQGLILKANFQSIPSLQTTTRMHSSSMRTARSWTVSRSVCHICPPCHTCLFCHACHPAMHAHLPHMPPTMHTPYHAYPLPHMPPAMHAPPAMHVPCHACPLPCTPPPVNSWHTLLKILPCPNFVAGGKYHIHLRTQQTIPTNAHKLDYFKIIVGLMNSLKE